MVEFNVLNIGIGFYILVTFILWSKKFEFKSLRFFPFGLSTDRYNHLIKRVSDRYKPFWITLGRVSHKVLRLLIFTVLIGIIVVMILLVFIQSWFSNFTIPIYLISWYNVTFDWSYYFVVIISFLIHELFHGVVAEAYDIEVDRVGVGLVPGILSFAYVGLDKKSLIKLSDEQRGPVRNWNNPNHRFQERANRYHPKIGRIGSVGLIGNLLVLLVGLGFVILGAMSSIDIISHLGIQMMSINLALIGLNIIPFGGLDGSKILSKYEKLAGYDYELETTESMYAGSPTNDENTKLTI